MRAGDVEATVAAGSATADTGPGMSEGSGEIVRQRLSLRETRRRRWDERLFVRFPGLVQALMRAVMRFPPRSRIRRWLVRHQWTRMLEAANRQDWDAVFAIVPSDPSEFETISAPEMVTLGFEPVYRGRAERLRYQMTWVEQLGDFQQEAKELIDLGDRMLLLARMRGTGLGSGAEFESELAYLVTISEGRPAREQAFRSHAEALEAAGLSG